MVSKPNQEAPDLEALKRRWDEICKDYFPQWSNQRDWAIKISYNSRGYRGRCVTAEMTLWITNGYHQQEPEELDRLLIHETCHAVVNYRRGHLASWQRRMEMAASRAEVLGRKALAKALREEVNKYRTNACGCHGNIYESVKKYVHAGSEIPSFDGVMESLAIQCGGNEDEEFNNIHRRCAEVYRKAVCARQGSEKARADRLAKIAAKQARKSPARSRQETRRNSNARI
jgi:hypothetical protein